MFWLVNPDDYNVLGRKFPNISENAIFFARTGIGNLFFVEDGVTGQNINYLNKHIGQVNLVSRGFADFMEFMLPSETVWKNDCYGKIELKAIKKQTFKPDECVTFIDSRQS